MKLFVLPSLALAAILFATGSAQAATVVIKPGRPGAAVVKPGRPGVVSPATVSAVQRALTRRGFYRGPVNGSVTPATSAALRAFERTRGLPITGTITPRVLTALGL